MRACTRSTQWSVAFSFAQPSPAWERSALGQRARCLLVCEVDEGKLDECTEGRGLPDAYLLASRTDAVTLSHVLVRVPCMRVCVTCAGVPSVALVVLAARCLMCRRVHVMRPLLLGGKGFGVRGPGRCTCS